MAQDFATYMTRFYGSQTTTPGAAGYYRVLTDNGATDQNCFAYAVGKATRINAQTRAQLIEEYEKMHYYEVSTAGAPQAGDAEVYSKPSAANQIVHAHRVVNATTARSKLGPGELIEHNILTLQAPKTANGNTYEYGTVFMRFRRDDAKFNARWETTRSGRLKRKTTSDDTSASKKPKPAAANPAAAKPAAAKPAATKPAATKPAATKTAAKPAAKPVVKKK